MCAGDISLDRWYWDKQDKTSYLLTDVPHMCRDFSLLSDWVKKYKYKPEDWIQHKPQKSTKPPAGESKNIAD